MQRIGFLTAILLLTACIQEETTDSADSNEVAFSANMLQRRTATRATYGYQGELDADALRESGAGFSVFAVLNDEEPYTKDGYASGKAFFNFMFNQMVEATGTTEWTYSPVKYWPNDFSTGDVGGGATGSKDGGRVTFFGYAPYTADPNGDMRGNSGIVDISDNVRETQETYITYRPRTEVVDGLHVIYPVSSTEAVDLLWALPLYDQKKPSITDKVNLTFKHALARLDIVAKALVDATDDTPAFNGYSDNVETTTRILIESVEVTNANLPYKGNMYLVPLPVESTTPRWTVMDFADKLEASIDIKTEAGESVINPDLTAADMPKRTDPAYTEASALARLAAMPEGVTSTEKPLLCSQDYYYLFPPNDNVATSTPMKVRLVYYTVTYDARLVLNNPKYFSIVRNDIEARMPSVVRFEAGKRYTLRLEPGLTSVKFTVTEVGQWNDDIILATTVKEWEPEEQSLDWKFE